MDVYNNLDLMISLEKEIEIDLDKIQTKMEVVSCYVLLTNIKKALQSYPSVEEKP